MGSGLVAGVIAVAVCIGCRAAVAAAPSIGVETLQPSSPQPTTAAITSGLADPGFAPVNAGALESGSGSIWLRLRTHETFAPTGTPALVVHRMRGVAVELYGSGGEAGAAPLRAVVIPEFRERQADLFVVPGGFSPDRPLYARVETHGRRIEDLRFMEATFEDALAQSAAHERTIALAVGALLALSIAALLIWLVLSEKLFLMYAGFFSLQALYIAYLSGQGFEWPALSWGGILGSKAWNVPVALSGAIACLFVRDVADLNSFSPRVYGIFRWLALAFLLLALANFALPPGLNWLLQGVGNATFIGTAVFTLVVAFLAWRRGSRAAGWFLVAWGLLEGYTIANAAHFLLGDSADAERLLYFRLPLSMVTAAVFAALGVAYRLRDQRRALTDAELLAQTDSLTGVLNRRSIIERLDASFQRSRIRNVPISLLFIDLDFFKNINDTYGHAAGDACLRAIVGPIQSELRQSDVIGRYGGEEFIVILNNADASAAHPIAERILKRVANIHVDGFGAPIALTCSIGVAASDSLAVSGEQLIARADAAVYAAKNAGRNRVRVAQPLAI